MPCRDSAVNATMTTADANSPTFLTRLAPERQASLLYLLHGAGHLQPPQAMSLYYQHGINFRTRLFIARNGASVRSKDSSEVRRGSIFRLCLGKNTPVSKQPSSQAGQ